MHQCQQVVSIPLKKSVDKGMTYLSLAGIKAVLDSIPTNTKPGLRDLAIISLLYDSAARVQELADLCIGDMRFNKPATLRLTGKGNKARVIPIMEATAGLVKKYLDCFKILESEAKKPVFANRVGKKLTRAGISYVLKKYVEKARANNPALIPEMCSPHSLRHSKSMHMLQAGVPLIYIRDYLGHVEISTTEVYARCDSSQKPLAIESAASPVSSIETPVWHDDSSLMQWLSSLC
jgi:site-specific recombinase XerD